MLDNPRLNIYRNTEFIGFIGDIIDFCQKANITALTALTATVATLEISYNEMNAAFKVVRHSDLTKTVQAIDLERDNAIKGIRAIILAYRYHHLPATVAASEALLNSIDKYGQNLSRFNYQAQTVTMNSLLNDWNTDQNLSEGVTTLKLTDWVAQLQTANDAFKVKYQERVTDMANKSTVAVSELRPAAVEAYNMLTKHIEANLVLNPSQALTDLTKEINELVMKYNSI